MIKIAEIILLIISLLGVGLALFGSGFSGGDPTFTFISFVFLLIVVVLFIFRNSHIIIKILYWLIASLPLLYIIFVSTQLYGINSY